MAERIVSIPRAFRLLLANAARRFSFRGSRRLSWRLACGLSWPRAAMSFVAATALAAATVAAPLGSATAQTSDGLDAARGEFATHYTMNRADFICRPDGAVWRLRSVTVDWVGEDLIIGETLRTPGEPRPNRVDTVFLVMSHVDARVSVHRRECDGGAMYQVEITCLRDCKIRLDGEALGAALRGDVDRSASYGGIWWFEFRDEASALEGAEMIRRLILGLPL